MAELLQTSVSTQTQKQWPPRAHRTHSDHFIWLTSSPCSVGFLGQIRGALDNTRTKCHWRGRTLKGPPKQNGKMWVLRTVPRWFRNWLIHHSRCIFHVVVCSTHISWARAGLGEYSVDQHSSGSALHLGSKVVRASVPTWEKVFRVWSQAYL